MPNYHVSLAILRLRDTQFNSASQNVALQLTDNPHFTTPLVLPADITMACTLFATRIQDAFQGGSMAVALKNQQRAVLTGLIRQEAAYVQSVAGDDLAKLLSSGFEAASTNRARVPLAKPTIELMFNPGSTVLGIKVTPVPNGRSYEVRLSVGAGPFQAAGTFTRSRPILLQNLTPGVVYTAQVRAVGGSTGYSDWSDPVSHMAM